MICSLMLVWHRSLEAGITCAVLMYYCVEASVCLVFSMFTAFVVTDGIVFIVGEMSHMNILCTSKDSSVHQDYFPS